MSTSYRVKHLQHLNIQVINKLNIQLLLKSAREETPELNPYDGMEGQPSQESKEPHKPKKTERETTNNNWDY